MQSGQSLLLAFFLTDLVACLMPGPAVATVMGIALTGSLRGMAGAIAGINVSNLIWYAMVGFGLVALVHAAPGLFLVLRWVGIAYLFWLGIRTWRSHPTLSVAGHGVRVSARQGFGGAMAVQLSNPKALIFFTVFLPPFIDASRPVAPQIALLAGIGVSLEVIVLLFYGLLAYRLGKFAVSPHAERQIARGSGAILMAIALAMALSRAS